MVVKILFLVFTISLLVPKLRSKPHYLTSDCPITTVFSPKSKYEANLNTLFQSLSSNATNSGFFSTAVNNMVYGLFLCRGDQNKTACSDCVSTAVTRDLPKTYCPNKKQAVIWYDQCMVRFSNHSVSGKMENSPEYYMINHMNTTGSQAGFSEVLHKTLNDTVASAGFGNKFATSAVNIKGGQPKTNLYTLAQCTPDLNTSACIECLHYAVSLLPLADGARIFGPSCNIRYEIYKFFTTPTPLTSAPALSPTSLNNPLSPAWSPQTEHADNPPAPAPALSPTSLNNPLSPPLSQQTEQADNTPAPVPTQAATDEPHSPPQSPQAGETDKTPAPALAPATDGTDTPVIPSPQTSASEKRTRSYFNFLGGVLFVVLILV